MPRSPTSTTFVIPDRSLTLATWAATVFGSPVLPANTSMATGMPAGEVSSPQTICSRPRTPSWAWPMAPSGQVRPSNAARETSYRTRVPPARCRAARPSSIGSCRPASQSIAAYRSSSSHAPRPKISPGELAAVSARRPRAIASWEPGAVTCAATIAATRSRARDLAGSISSSRPSSRIVPGTAATCPCGRLREISNAPSSPAGGSPFSARDSASTVASGQAGRLASVRFLTLAALAVAFPQQHRRRRVPVRHPGDVPDCRFSPV